MHQTWYENYVLRNCQIYGGVLVEPSYTYFSKFQPIPVYSSLRNVVSLIALMVIKNFFQRQILFIILYHAFIVVIFQCLYLFQPKNYDKKKNTKRPEEKSIINTSCPSSYNFLRVHSLKPYSTYLLWYLLF